MRHRRSRGPRDGRRRSHWSWHWATAQTQAYTTKTSVCARLDRAPTAENAERGQAICRRRVPAAWKRERQIVGYAVRFLPWIFRTDPHKCNKPKLTSEIVTPAWERGSICRAALVRNIASPNAWYVPFDSHVEANSEAASLNGARSACRPSTLRVRPVNFALSRSQHRQDTIDGIVRWPACGPALCRWAQRQGWSGEESSRNRATRSVDAGEGRTSAHRTRNTNSATSHVTESGARSPGCWHAHAAACTNAQRGRGVHTLINRGRS